MSALLYINSGGQASAAAAEKDRERWHDLAVKQREHREKIRALHRKIRAERAARQARMAANKARRLMAKSRRIGSQIDRVV